MTDLTAITTPFGLLDEVYGPGTQEALKAHGGPWEVFTGKRWDSPRSSFFDDPDPAFVIRVKPAPPKPRDLWLVEWGVDAEPDRCVEFTEREAAKAVSSLVTNGHRNVRLSRFAEVLPE